jgi:cbb3-type cytochrome oxidase maturation protein
MSVLFVALPVALLISIAFVATFVWQVRSGQLDDLETPPRRILFDDIPGACPRETSSSCPPPAMTTTARKESD